MNKIDDPYYFGNNEFPPTILNFTVGFETITQELPWDISGDELTEAFVIDLLYLFDEKSILEVMKDFNPSVKSRPAFNSKMLEEITIQVKTGDKNITLKLGKYCNIPILLHAFVTICIKLTFEIETAYKMINEYAEYRLEELESCKKEEDKEE